MSGFDGSRRGPNVSQYIANLNAIPSSHDVVNQHDGAYNLEEDLAVFTNAEFYDFDIGEDIDQQPMPYDPSQEERARRENAAPHKSAGKALDYSQNHGEFFSPIPPYLSPSTAIPSTLDPNFANIATPYGPSNNTYPAALTSPTTAAPMGGELSPVASPTSPTTNETPSSRLAAEEDKRRRNTAASARFRVKKKQREQALERQAKELADKTKTLEDRVARLETENEWLRGLVVERDGREGLEEAVEGWRRRKGKESTAAGGGAVKDE